MPYKYEWLIEGQLVSAEIWGDQTMDELVESNAFLVDKLDHSDRLIHVIMTDAKLESVPTNLVQLQKVMTYTSHPKMGWVVMYGEKDQGIKDSVQDFLIIMLAKLARLRYIRFKTFDEAVEHVRKTDQSIDWNAVNAQFKHKVQF